ncbi:MAG: hypothetical protein AVDCRST_MAG27-1741, partial [uncultured Craurococcus sp.]
AHPAPRSPSPCLRLYRRFRACGHDPAHDQHQCARRLHDAGGTDEAGPAGQGRHPRPERPGGGRPADPADAGGGAGGADPAAATRFLARPARL